MLVPILITLVALTTIAAMLASRWSKTVRLDTRTGRQTVTVGFRSTSPRRRRTSNRGRRTTRRK